MSLSGVRGIAAGVRVVGRAGLVVCAVLGGLVVPAAVSGSEAAGGEVEVRVVARKAADGRVEFGLRQRLSEDSWGEIRLPERRYFPAATPVGRWLGSSPVTLTAALSDGLEVRVVARRAADGRVEFGLRQRLSEDSWGEIRLPSRRFFPAATPVGRWLQSSPVGLRVPVGAEGADSPDVEPPGEGYVSVAVGGANFACGLRVDGSVRCWGAGRAAQSPEGTFSRVAAGTRVMCGVREGGELHCWGPNSAWPYHDRDPSLLTSVPAGLFSEVAVGTRAACGIRVDGEVECWGADGASWRPPDGRFSAVAVGVDSGAPGPETAGCGLRTDGSAACWGSSPDAWVPPGGRFESLAVGSRYACGEWVGVGLVCWGPAVVLGNDWVEQSGVLSPPEGRFVAVAANADFSCAVEVGGEVECWGSQGVFRCEYYESYECSGWGGTPIPEGPFSSVAVAKVLPGPFSGRQQICGVRPSGKLVCWNDRSPVVAGPAGEFLSVDVGGCGVRVGGQAVCWTDGVEYQVARGVYSVARGAARFGCGLRDDGEIICWGANRWGAAYPPPGPFIDVDVAVAGLGCGLRPDGEAVCWGRTEAGQADPPPGPFTAIRVVWHRAGSYPCGLRADASAACWGPPAALERQDPEAVFAVPDFEAVDSPWRESYPGGYFVSVDAATSTACGIRPGGALECWSDWWAPGRWATLELPVRELTDRRRPDPENPGVPEGLAWVRGDVTGGPFVALDSGQESTCGLRADGVVECWGQQAGSPGGPFASVAVGWGQGAGTRPDGSIESWWKHSVTGTFHRSDTPQSLRAPHGQRFVALDYNWAFLCGLLDSGRILCERDVPAGPQGESFNRFSVGSGVLDTGLNGSGWSDESTHVCAITEEGALACWGDNDAGQTVLPAPWVDDPPYRDVAAGFKHTCVITDAGKTICWGDYRYDQTRSPPGTFTALSAGQWHTCGLRTDGEITCWGDGAAGLNLRYDAPPADRPTQPPPGPYTAVSAGYWHTCALRPDGTATCWLSY